MRLSTNLTCQLKVFKGVLHRNCFLMDLNAIESSVCISKNFTHNISTFYISIDAMYLLSSLNMLKTRLEL